MVHFNNCCKRGLFFLVLFILGRKTSSNNLQQFEYKNDISNILHRC